MHCPTELVSFDEDGAARVDMDALAREMLYSFQQEMLRLARDWDETSKTDPDLVSEEDVEALGALNDTLDHIVETGCDVPVFMSRDDLEIAREAIWHARGGPEREKERKRLVDLARKASESF